MRQARHTHHDRAGLALAREEQREREDRNSNEKEGKIGRSSPTAPGAAEAGVKVALGALEYDQGIDVCEKSGTPIERTNTHNTAQNRPQTQVRIHTPT